MNVNLRLLQAFMEVAEHQNFRRAAEAIGRTQSAVSMQILQLEQQVGVKLFHRTTRQVRLTIEGEKLLTHVRTAMVELMAGLRQAEGVSPSHRGRVSLACAPSVAGSRLPAVMASFKAAFPNVTARVWELPLAGIVDRVRAQEVDFGIGPTPLSMNGLEFSSILTEPICALLPTGLIQGRNAVAWQALAAHPIVMMGGLREKVETTARSAGVELAIRYEAQQILTLQGLVLAGLGVGIIPRIAVPDSRPRGLQVLPITGPALLREVGIISQSGRKLSPLATEFTRILPKLISAA
jgi:LysR family carnitine catabolism transcriptional activator